MNYLLDTNIIIYLYFPQSPHRDKVLSHITSVHTYSVSALTLFELEYSLANAPEEKQPRIAKNIQAVKQNFQIVPLKEEAASLFGQLKAALKKARHISSENMKKQNIDVMLASTALLENYTLVSHRDIYPVLAEEFPKLQFENWIDS